MQKLTHLFFVVFVAVYARCTMHDARCKMFYWATRWVPSELVIEGDQPSM